MTFNAFTARLIEAINADDRGFAKEDRDGNVTIGRMLSRGRFDHMGIVKRVNSKNNVVESEDDLIISARKQAGYIRDMCLSALR